jgi:hypothetical protein
MKWIMLSMVLFGMAMCLTILSPSPACPVRTEKAPAAAGEKEAAGDPFDQFASKIEPRRMALLRELKDGPTLPWEGIFSRATFSASEGWVVSKSGYVSTGKVRDMGKVESISTRIKFISESPLHPFPGHSRTLELIVVQWGGRVYLVDPKLMISFCNAVNSGELLLSPLPALYYVKAGGGHKKPSTLPDIPGEYKDYLLKKPLAATILSVRTKETGVRIVGQPYPLTGIVVTVDVGSRDGVLPGMQLFFQNRRIRGDAYIISVTDHKSRFILTGLGEDEERLCVAGLRLTSRDPLYSSPAPAD